MQTQTISKAPRKMRIEAIQGKQTFEEIDRLDNIARDAWTALFTAVRTGERDYIYWDDNPVERAGYSSFLRHLLTRSTKQDNALQLTAFQVKQGELIPLSDIQITDPAELFKEAPNTAKVNIF